MSKIYYSKIRRKWENDFLMLNYSDFDFLPKIKIDHDNVKILQKYIRLKLILKGSFLYPVFLNILKFASKVSSFLRYLELSIFTGLHLNSFSRFDGAVLRSFIRTSKINYLIYVENPASIINYDYKVNTSYLRCMFRNNFIKNIQKKNFKGFVFFSYFSKEIFYKYYEDLIEYEHKFKGVIYPFTLNNSYIVEPYSKSLLTKSEIKLLFISSLFSLKGGCEVLEAFKILEDCHSLSLTIVTNSKTIPERYLSIISESNNISLKENQLNNEELQKLYFDCHVLLHPTSMDSTAIVVMEALKSGLPVIASDIFAISEYIDHGTNGFLIENSIKFFDKDFKINESIDFKNAAVTLDNYKSMNIDSYIVRDIVHYCNLVFKDYSYYSLNAYKSAMKSEFEEKYIFEKWEQIIKNELL